LNRNTQKSFILKIADRLREDVQSTILIYKRVKLMKLKGRVTAYLPEEIQAALEKWAEEESRSLSSLATYLLTKAVKDRQQQDKKD
jgi:hypothetical protein